MEAVISRHEMVFSDWGNMVEKYEPVVRRGSKIFSV